MRPMGALAASGTLGGSTSCSRSSIQKEAARSEFSRLGRHPYRHTTRTTLPTVVESEGVVGHDFRSREKQQRDLGPTW